MTTLDAGRATLELGTPWRSVDARLDAPAGLHVTVFTEPDRPPA